MYCNYDKHSYEFSKTYRAIYQNEKPESIVKRHREYYYCGYYLKEALYEYGERMIDGPHKLYHGISDKLMIKVIKFIG